MKIENPLAFRYIMQDEIYLLENDKASFEHLTPQEAFFETPAINFNYLGGNNKKFVVLTHYEETEFMDQQHLIALENTLKRLNFVLDDVAIFNIAKNGKVEFDVLADFFNPVKLLILGKDALPANFGELQFNMLKVLNNCTALYTFSFGEMMESNGNKKLFWEQMKQL